MKYINKFAVVLIVVVLIFCVPNLIKQFYPYKYSDYIIKYSKQNNLDPMFVAAVIKTESNFNEKALSNKNAYGLMQITAETAQWSSQKMGIVNFRLYMLNDPELNIKMGCWYLNNLNREFGNFDLVLAAYNGGRGNVEKWLKDSNHSIDGKNLQYIPFKETDKYVKRVNVNYSIYKFLYK